MEKLKKQKKYMKSVEKKYQDERDQERNEQIRRKEKSDLMLDLKM